MKPTPKKYLTDVEIIGIRTTFRAVIAGGAAERGWLRKMPECHLLSSYNIAHTGIMDARKPYEIVRVDQSGTFMLACLEGEGVVLVDGVWKTIRSGQACLLPPFVLNSLKCTATDPWRFAWVRYEESRDTKPIISSVSPVTGGFDGQALAAAITGLHAEISASNDPASLQQWCALINHYVMRFAQPTHLDERLWRLWSRVENQPAHPWTLDAFSEIAHLSTEHLRRLCLREIGRSPMRHLTFIRLQLSVRLLSSGNDKIESIARAVGFSGIHSFSNAFRRRFGRPPSDFR